MVRQGLAAMLAGERGLACVGEAGDGEQALRAAPALHPQLLVLQIDLPGMDLIAMLTALRALLPQARYVLLGGALEPRAVRRAQAAGATGFLLNHAGTAEVVRTLRATHNGQSAMPITLTQALSSSERHGEIGDDLTQREHELLSLMARGLSNQDISTQLGIAMPTVKFHVTNILVKLHADNRTSAVLVALRKGLVDLG